MASGRIGVHHKINGKMLAISLKTKLNREKDMNVAEAREKLIVLRRKEKIQFLRTYKQT